MSETTAPFDPDNMDDFDKKLTESKYMNIAMQEFALAHAEAITLVISAAARQLDLPKLATDLRSLLEVAQTTKMFHPVGLKMAASVYKTLDSQVMAKKTAANRSKNKH